MANLLLLVGLVILPGARLEAQSILTIAGGGTDDGRPATQVSLSLSTAVAFDSAGNLYVSSLDAVRRRDAISRVITMVAGTGEQGYRGDGGPATQALLDDPNGVAIGAAGELYIADSGSHRIRAVFPCVSVDEPVPLSPSDGSLGLSSSQSLEWRTAHGAFRYDVYVDTANPPQRIVGHDLETTPFSVSGLEPLTTYYWKVVARGDPFCAPFRTSDSEVWSFTTTSSCQVP